MTIPLQDLQHDGLAVYYKADLAATKQEVKDNPGRLYGWHIYNSDNTSVVYVQFFDADSADVTVGTTAPDFVLVVPPATVLEEVFEKPLDFDNAITVAATATASGSGAPAATQHTVLFYY